jgi:V/A-type H+-transporting ATPase subunit F
MKFYCIGNEETARGFRLAGVEGRAVRDAAEAAAALSAAAGRADCGVIIMTAAAAALVRTQVDEIKLERPRPLIVEI